MSAGTSVSNDHDIRLCSFRSNHTKNKRTANQKPHYLLLIKPCLLETLTSLDKLFQSKVLSHILLPKSEPISIKCSHVKDHPKKRHYCLFIALGFSGFETKNCFLMKS